MYMLSGPCSDVVFAVHHPQANARVQVMHDPQGPWIAEHRAGDAKAGLSVASIITVQASMQNHFSCQPAKQAVIVVMQCLSSQRGRRC